MLLLTNHQNSQAHPGMDARCEIQEASERVAESHAGYAGLSF